MGLYPTDAIENAYNHKHHNALELGIYSLVRTLERSFSYGWFCRLPNLASQRLQRHAGITALHILLFPLIMSPSFSPASAV